MGIYDRATREKVVLASGNIFLNVMGKCRASGPDFTMRSCVCVCVCSCICAQRGSPGNHLPKCLLCCQWTLFFPTIALKGARRLAMLPQSLGLNFHFVR